MKLNKANKRDKKNFNKRNGMRVSGKSVLVIRQAIINRGNKKKKGK